MKLVYLDNAATTCIREEVVTAITEVMQRNYGNASSSHSFGRSAKVLIEQARKAIAYHLNATAGEIVFTSGGTEADNLVLRSAVKDLGVTHIITSRIEHHAVLHTVEQLQEETHINVSYVNINAHGDVDYTHLESLLQADQKTLVSLMHINNEIGNILDIKRVSLLCKAHNALFHCDAVQSVGRYALDLQEIPIDFLVASAHKFHGPKGIGFLFVRKNTMLKPLITGGEQERGLRAGTESVHNIIGMEAALKYAYNHLETEAQTIKNLKAYFITELTKAIPDAICNGVSGDLDQSTYTLVNVRFSMSAEKAAMLLFQLDLKGIACSRGSACQSGSSKKSHVLIEVLNETDLQKASLRFSFSSYNTREEVDYVIATLQQIIVPDN